MIVDERMVAYLASLDSPLSPELTQVQREAREEGVPIIRQSMQSFLHMFIEIMKPQKILEVGAATGFSSLLMAERSDENCRITTMEIYEPRIIKARENIAKHPQGSKIELLAGDAAEILPTLEGPYDMIFMDAAKGQYINFMPEVMRLLRAGGILISDNVLQDGDIIESHYAVTRRNRTIYKRMRDYLYELTHSEDLVTSVIPIGDGAAVSVKRT